MVGVRLHRARKQTRRNHGASLIKGLARRTLTRRRAGGSRCGSGLECGGGSGCGKRESDLRLGFSCRSILSGLTSTADEPGSFSSTGGVSRFSIYIYSMYSCHGRVDSILRIARNVKCRTSPLPAPSTGPGKGNPKGRRQAAGSIKAKLLQRRPRARSSSRTTITVKLGDTRACMLCVSWPSLGQRSQ